MSDITDRIADVLRKHYFWWPNHSSIGSEAHCQCGQRPRDWSYWADHAAGAVAEELKEVVTDAEMWGAVANMYQRMTPKSVT